MSVCVSLQSLGMDFNLLTDSEARSPALSLSDSGTPQHDQGCKGQDNSGKIIRPTVHRPNHHNDLEMEENAQNNDSCGSIRHIMHTKQQETFDGLIVIILWRGRQISVQQL